MTFQSDFARFQFLQLFFSPVTHTAVRLVFFCKPSPKIFRVREQKIAQNPALYKSRYFVQLFFQIRRSLGTKSCTKSNDHKIKVTVKCETATHIVRAKISSWINRVSCNFLFPHSTSLEIQPYKIKNSHFLFNLNNIIKNGAALKS